MKQKLWNENCDFYFRDIGGYPTVINLDLGASDWAPLATHSWRVEVRVPLQWPREDGLRRREEAPILFALEDELCRRFAAVAELLFVGRLVGAGQLYLFFYGTPAAQGAEPALREILDSVRGDHDAFLSVKPDPDWDLYLDFLLPDPIDLQIMINRRQLETLADQGDDGNLPREVEHSAIFARHTAADRAARLLGETGFLVDRPRPVTGLRSGDPALRWELDFSRVDALASGRIHEICAELMDIVLASEGDYEGWTSLVLAKRPRWSQPREVAPVENVLSV